MNKNDDYKKYIRKVMREIPVYGKKKRAIETDLLNSLHEREQLNPGKNPIELMGEADQLSSEFRDNLGLGEVRGFEYQSKKEWFNIPLVHINLRPNGVAKGIFALGPVAVGAVSVGAVAIGLLSFGAFTFGILAALGAVAFSGLISLGAAAFSIGMSMGAVAMANYYAIGAFAQANIAIGSVAHGVVAVFRESGQGDLMVQLPALRGDVLMAVKAAYPGISQFWLNFVLFPF